MAAPAGSLVVKIGSDTAGLTRGTRQTESVLGRLGRTAGRVAGGLATIGAAAATAAAAGLAAFVTAGLRAVDSQAELAQSVGGTIAQIRALTNVSEDFGVSSQEMAANLQRMNRRLGEVVSQGAGPAAAWIERLGINAEKILELPLDERVAVIADEISELGSTAEMAAAAFAIFGDAGLRMVPMIQQGGDAIRAEREEVERLGLALSQVDAAKVEQANAALGIFGDVMAAIRDRVVVALAPILSGIAELFRSIALEVGGFQEAVSTAFTVVGRAGGVVVDIIAVQIAFWQKMREISFSVLEAIGRGLSWLGDRFREMVNTIIRAVNTVADFLPGIQGGIEEIQPGWIGRRFEDAMGAAREAVAVSMAFIREQLGGEFPSENIRRWFEEAQAQAQKAAAAAVKVRGSLLGGLLPGDGDGDTGESEQEAFERRLERIRARFLTEQEALREHKQILADIDRAFREGEIATEEEYRAIREQAEADHMERMKRIRERGNRDLEKETDKTWKDQLESVDRLGGQMVSAAGTINDDLFKIAKIGGAALAFVSTLTGAAKALELGWPAGPIAAAKVMAQGLGFVGAIKAASMGGGGGGGGGAAATPDTSLPTTPDTGGGTGQGDFVQDVSVTLVGGNQIGAEQLEQLGEVLADNGGRIGAFKVVRA